MRKVVFVLSIIMGARAAMAYLPTAGYVSEYLYRQCANANLDVPGGGVSHLTSQKYILDIIDILNDGATTYGPDATTNHIVSVDYVTSALQYLAESPICCLGGYYENSTGECTSCGEWMADSTDKCFDAGEYYNDGVCSKCGDGYICSAGTASRVACGAGYWCTNNQRHKCDNGVNQCPDRHHTSQPTTIGCSAQVIATTPADECVAAGIYFDGTKCAPCPAGYLCPDGTPNRTNCGPGYWCANNVRNACNDGIRECPASNHGAAPDVRGCDETWNFTN